MNLTEIQRPVFFITIALSMMSEGNAQTTPQIFEEFNGWTGVTSPDGVWRRNGDWTGTGNNLLTLADAVVSTTSNGVSGGYLTLTVKANKLEGGEIQTIGTVGSALGYGYYEVRMKVSSVSGCCNSFFWKEVNYGPGEIDLEFLTNETWTSTNGQVHCQLHNSNYDGGGPKTFPFDPSAQFHRYGFLWTADKIDWTADGQVIQTLSGPSSSIPATKGYIMMNAWTGNANLGGGPPTQDAPCVYDWVKFWPGVTSIPSEASTEIRRNVQPDKISFRQAVQTADPVAALAGLEIGRTDATIFLYDYSGRMAGAFVMRNGLIMRPGRYLAA